LISAGPIKNRPGKYGARTSDSNETILTLPVLCEGFRLNGTAGDFKLTEIEDFSIAHWQICLVKSLTH
jgi:hypothetical protein